MPTRETVYKRRYDRNISELEERSRGVLDKYLEDALAFDPSAIYEMRTKGAFEDFSDVLGKNLESLRASQVAGGRSRTGFAFRDQDRLVETLGKDLSRRLAEYSLQAGNQDLARLSLLRGSAHDLLGTSLDHIGGVYNTERSQRLQDEADKRKGQSDLLSGILSIAGAGIGFAAGGPGGAIVGSNLGRVTG